MISSALDGQFLQAETRAEFLIWSTRLTRKCAWTRRQGVAHRGAVRGVATARKKEALAMTNRCEVHTLPVRHGQSVLESRKPFHRLGLNVGLTRRATARPKSG